MSSRGAQPDYIGESEQQGSLHDKIMQRILMCHNTNSKKSDLNITSRLNRAIHRVNARKYSIPSPGISHTVPFYSNSADRSLSFVSLLGERSLDDVSDILSGVHQWTQSGCVGGDCRQAV